MKIAAVYVRISDDKAGEGLGVQRQETDCRKLAKELGFKHVVVFTDNDISAYSGRRRPAYEEMLAQISSGVICAVISWHGDRLHRSPIELEAYIDLVEKHEVSTHLVTGGRVDLSTPTGRLMARMVGNYSRFESEHKAERVARAHRQAAEQGKWRGGTRPFGYQEGGQAAHPEEAELIVRAYQDVLEGLSLSELCRNWNARGIVTTTGRKWGIQSLKQLLLRERNYGASVYRGQVVGEGNWQPIVEEAVFKQAWLLLTDPSRRRSYSTRSRWLLAGVALCGVCESEGQSSTVRSATATSPGRSWKIYRCKTGTHLARSAEPTDKLVQESILAYLARRDNQETLADSLPRPEGASAAARRESDLQRRLQEARKLYKDDIISADDLRTVKAQVDQELAALSLTKAPDRTRPIVGKLSGAKDIRAAWEKLAVDERKMVVQSLMTVTILPVPSTMQRRFQKELIRIDWKTPN
ncbi:recombinase family protein [Sinomonas gamaensis]|uniref:recombinase family protein n=1 Tax=Sinomonas gamaensis TaxID=2565624 RepID=UPI001485D764|nr:recombinase family protein [Sinomonas gamaensis]